MSVQIQEYKAKWYHENKVKHNIKTKKYYEVHGWGLKSL